MRVVVPFCLAVCALAASLAGCATSQVYIRQTAGEEVIEPPPDPERTYQVFLAGNVADGNAERPALDLLARHLAQAGEQSAAVFIGNLAGAYGLPDSSAAERAYAEARLRELAAAVDGFAGEVILVPGRGDWAGGGPDGQAAVERMESYVQDLMDRGNIVKPDDGFPGPFRIRLTDDIRLIALDTQWWLHRHDKPFGDTDGYDLGEAGDFLNEFEDQLRQDSNKDVLVVGYHPMYANGTRAGRFPTWRHLAPPVLGSAAPLYRRLIGRDQDLAHENYARLRSEFERLFFQRDNLIYASAHEHSLQYTRVGGPRFFQHHLISGSLAATDYVAGSGQASFTARREGFLVLNYFDDGSIWLDAFAADGSENGTLLYQTRLKQPRPDPAPEAPLLAEADLPDYTDQTVTQAANPDYAKPSFFLRRFVGNHHRDLWAIPVEAPVFDVGTATGGLTPVRLGGRGQSISMRLANDEGHEYVLRSIDKVAGKVWTPALRNTFLLRFTQDQFAMLHPYAAFILPPLASAAGVYHTNPRLVYVPDDPRLGPYRTDLVGQLALFEERPDDDMSHVASMGQSDDVMSHADMLRAITRDNDHRVDARQWARTRLFDMLIADWDRHYDQWRWAQFNAPDGKRYAPIPRDRDVALMNLDGLFSTLFMLLFDPKNQDFGDDYGYLRGLNKNAFNLDRRFAASLTRADWIALADSIATALPDSLIEAAVQQWPPPIYAANGEQTNAIFKARRDKLAEVASEYYDLLARDVDIVGSDKHERFEVTRRDDSTTDVVVWKTSKEGEIRREFYRRTFRHDETREIRLYGLDGNDQFVVHGDARDGLRVIAVGGPGEDRFEDTSSVRGWRKHTRFYDTRTGNTWATGPETKTVRRRDTGVNTYAMNGYTYDLTRPAVFFGANPDDGLFVGGGVQVTKHAFRRVPYARHHRLVANVAGATWAYNVRYTGHFVDVLGSWDLGLEMLATSPSTIRNFYGLGNETTQDRRSRQFYQARFTQVLVRPSLLQQVRENVLFAARPFVEYTNVREDPGRFIGQPQAGVSPNTFEEQWYGGLRTDLTLTTVTDAQNPRQGFTWTGSAEINQGLRSTSTDFTRLSSELRLYASPSLEPQVTLALRAGVAHTLGTFPFWAANTLGGSENLRGHIGTRFAGRTSTFQSAELRAQLFDFAGYFGFGTVGLLGFADTGRVWTDGEDSDVWHLGLGGGFWVHAFEAVILSAHLGFSEDDTTFGVGLGFFF